MINVLHYILIPFKIILFVVLIILGIYILKHTYNDGNITTLIIVFYKFVVHCLMSYNIEISDEDYKKKIEIPKQKKMLRSSLKLKNKLYN